MKTLVALLLLAAFPVFAADPPADAPLDEPGRALVLEQGSIAPYAGVLLDAQEDVRRARARVRAEAELADAKENVWTSKGLLVGVVIGALVLGAAAGAGVTAYALTRK